MEGFGSSALSLTHATELGRAPYVMGYVGARPNSVAFFRVAALL